MTFAGGKYAEMEFKMCAGGGVHEGPKNSIGEKSSVRGRL